MIELVALVGALSALNGLCVVLMAGESKAKPVLAGRDLVPVILYVYSAGARIRRGA